LRPCCADAIAVAGEQKRNTKLQPTDSWRHLHGLNPEQRGAVEYGIGGDAERSQALLIAAGAGTGKTKVLLKVGFTEANTGPADCRANRHQHA
jgi:hypothetical protein